MKRRQFLAAASGATATALAGCSGSDDDDTNPGADIPDEEVGAIVTMTDDGFDTPIVEVDEGMAVRWDNQAENNTYTIRDYEEDWSDSWDFEAEIEPDEIAAYKYEESGVYIYYDETRTRFTMCGAAIVGDATEEDLEQLPCGPLRDSGSDSDEESGSDDGSETDEDADSDSASNETDDGSDSE